MKKETKLQKCWIWNDTVAEFVKKRVKGYSLNVCAGKSDIGDVKIDLDPKDRSVIKGDFKFLKFSFFFHSSSHAEDQQQPQPQPQPQP